MFAKKYLILIELLELQKIIDSEDFTEEEKLFLKRLTEEPTSVSADLLPMPSSFASNTMSDADVKLLQPVRSSVSTLGLGFDPGAIEPESGFKPIVEGQGSSIPSLAFSVLDGVERPPVSPGLYQQQDFISKRQQVLDLLENRRMDHDAVRRVNVCCATAVLTRFFSAQLRFSYSR